MVKMIYEFKVTSQSLDKIKPSLDRPIKIECLDSRYTLGDGGILFVVSMVSDGTFWAYDRKTFENGDTEIKGLRQYAASRLKSYQFSIDDLPKKKIIMRIDNQGRLIAVDANGKPVGEETFPEGITIEIPYVDL